MENITIKITQARQRGSGAVDVAIIDFKTVSIIHYCLSASDQSAAGTSRK